MKKYILFLIIIHSISACGNKNNVENDENKEDSLNEKNVSQDEINTTQNSEITTYFLIRHAEKMRDNPKEEDPNLSPKGFERAKKWVAYFENTKINKLYVTKYVRTQQTVEPLAEQKSLEMTIYNPNDFDLKTFLAETKGENIVIAGHSNTIPEFVNSLIGEEKFQDMADNDNSTLFVVTINGSDKKVETITVN